MQLFNFQLVYTAVLGAGSGFDGTIIKRSPFLPVYQNASMMELEDSEIEVSSEFGVPAKNFPEAQTKAAEIMWNVREDTRLTDVEFTSQLVTVANRQHCVQAIRILCDIEAPDDLTTYSDDDLRSAVDYLLKESDESLVDYETVHLLARTITLGGNIHISVALKQPDSAAFPLSDTLYRWKFRDIDWRSVSKYEAQQARALIYLSTRLQELDFQRIEPLISDSGEQQMFVPVDDPELVSIVKEQPHKVDQIIDIIVENDITEGYSVVRKHLLKRAAMNYGYRARNPFMELWPPL